MQLLGVMLTLLAVAANCGGERGEKELQGIWKFRCERYMIHMNHLRLEEQHSACQSPRTVAWVRGRRSREGE